LPHLVLAGWGLAAPCLPLKRVGVEIGVLGIPGPAPQDAYLGVGQEREGVCHEREDYHPISRPEQALGLASHWIALFVEELGVEHAAALHDDEDFRLHRRVVVLAQDHVLPGVGTDDDVLERAHLS
jgi:hypothetical protein